MNQSDIQRIINLKMQLDSVTNVIERERLIRQEIQRLRNVGKTDAEIKKLFQYDKVMEAQDTSAMIQNHKEYVDIANKILAEKK